MAVNQALIQASKGTGEQFIDYGAVLQPAVKGMMRDLEIADNKMASFVNSLPPGANIEKLPEGMRPEVERYLRDSKNEYAEAAKVASKLSPSDAGYREAVDRMNSIKTGFVNLNKNLEAHLANRVEFIQDKNDLSGSLLDNDNIFLTSVYAGDYEGFKVTGGELEFLDKSTNKYKRNSEFPQYSLTDAVGANKITDLRFNARQTALKYGDIDVAGYQSGVSNLFKGLGAQGVIDMAFDGLDNAAGNFVDTEIRNFKEFKNLSDDQWAVEREKLKTKEGFSNYFIPFQQHVSRLVNAGAIEGKAAYDKTINLNNNKNQGFAVPGGTFGDAGYISYRNESFIRRQAADIDRGKQIINFGSENYVYDKENKRYTIESPGVDNGVVITKQQIADRMGIDLSLIKSKNVDIDPDSVDDATGTTYEIMANNDVTVADAWNKTLIPRNNVNNKYGLKFVASGGVFGNSIQLVDKNNNPVNLENIQEMIEGKEYLTLYREGELAEFETGGEYGSQVNNFNKIIELLGSEGLDVLDDDGL